MSDFVYPERKLFPINKPEDISIALDAYKFFSDEISYSEFVNRIINLAKKKGPNYIQALPHKLKSMVGQCRENTPERPERPLHHRKKPTRFKHYDEEE